jgi:hypothetical protein
MLHDAFTLGLLGLGDDEIGLSPIAYTSGCPNVIIGLGQE